MAKRSALIVNIHIYYEQTEMNVIIFVSLPLLISHEFYTFCINDWSHDMQDQKIYMFLLSISVLFSSTNI